MPATKPAAKSKPGKGKPKVARRGTGTAGKPAKAPASAAKAPAGAAKAAAAARPGGRSRSPDVSAADPQLFDPLTPGEVADALRTLIEDRRLASMAKIGRYRVICTEPLVVKPPHWMSGHRLARVVAYDYSQDRAVDACVDLDAGVVAHLELTKAQPMLSREEEALAISIAATDERVREKLELGDVAQWAMHYWGRSPNDLAFARRSAAVLYGRDGGHSSVVAVVDLIDQQVTRVVPAEQW